MPGYYSRHTDRLTSLHPCDLCLPRLPCKTVLKELPKGGFTGVAQLCDGTGVNLLAQLNLFHSTGVGCNLRSYELLAHRSHRFTQIIFFLAGIRPARKRLSALRAGTATSLQWTPSGWRVSILGIQTCLCLFHRCASVSIGGL